MNRSQFIKSAIVGTVAGVSAFNGILNLKNLFRSVFRKKKGVILIGPYDIYNRDFHKKLISRYPYRMHDAYIKSLRLSEKRSIGKHQYTFLEDNPEALKRIAKALNHE